jgi:hypothetical protein
VDVAQILPGLILARTGGIVLLWIARPAAQVELPPLTSRRAVAEIVVGLVAAAFAPLFLVTTLAAVRVVMALSYRAWGGIRSSSLAWTRAVAASAVFLIASLPEWSPSLFAR